MPGTQGGHTREIARDRARLLPVTRSSSMLVSLLLARYYKQKVGNLDRVIMTSTDRGTGCLRIEFEVLVSVFLKLWELVHKGLWGS